MLLHRVLKYGILLGITYIAFLLYVGFAPHHLPVSQWKTSKAAAPGDTIDNLFWFVQVSDIHVSQFRDPTRYTDFKEFCSSTLPLINPDVVLVTGDLVDAKYPNFIGSSQFEEEWKIYNNILMETNVTNEFVWLDVRGNHDAFDVISLEDKTNYYAKYSGDKGVKTKYAFELHKPFGKYSFIQVDATMNPGPKRPFNFIGSVSKPNYNLIEKESIQHSTNNLTFYYGHYPISSINLAAQMGLSSLIGKYGVAHFCGHLHTFHGYVPRMHAMHSQGFLELELGDWKQGRMYRVIAVDHDMMSFDDVTHKDWPVVIVTNPKPATYLTPKHEPILQMRKSSHVRILIFGAHKIESVVVKINGKLLGNAVFVKGPLYVCKWDPSNYFSGVHEMIVTVTDANGKVKVIKNEFSLDDKWPTTFSLAAVIILLTDFCSIIKLLFIGIGISCLTIILSVKIHGVGIPSSSNKIGETFFRLQLLLSDQFSFYSILFFFVNILIGPHFIGEIVTNHIGACFSYGLLVDGKLQSENILYAYSSVAIIVFYIPVTLYLSYCAELHWHSRKTFVETLWPISKSTLYHILFVIHVMLQYLWCCEVWVAYGDMALLFCVSRLWFVIASIILACRVWLIDKQNARRPRI